MKGASFIMGLTKKVYQIIEASFSGRMYKDMDNLISRMENDVEHILERNSSKFGVKWLNEINKMGDSYGRSFLVEFIKRISSNQLLNPITKDWIKKKINV